MTALWPALRALAGLIPSIPLIPMLRRALPRAAARRATALPPGGAQEGPCPVAPGGAGPSPQHPRWIIRPLPDGGPRGYAVVQAARQPWDTASFPAIGAAGPVTPARDPGDGRLPVRLIPPWAGFDGPITRARCARWLAARDNRIGAAA
jgi:hypothetical protein